jgi:hypothetical protein
MRKRILIENLIKNIVITVLLVLFFFESRNFLLHTNTDDYDSIVLLSSLLIVAFLFADYSFTYELSNLKDMKERILGHIITGIIIFGTGALLEIALTTLNFKIQRQFVLLDLLGLLFYLSLVLYDFWDLERGLKKHS